SIVPVAAISVPAGRPSMTGASRYSAMPPVSSWTKPFRSDSRAPAAVVKTPMIVAVEPSGSARAAAMDVTGCGVGVGAAVGSGDGATVGVSVGATVGSRVGATVGSRVGATVDSGVGAAVGMELGSVVGDGVGPSVGDGTTV